MRARVAVVVVWAITGCGRIAAPPTGHANTAALSIPCDPTELLGEIAAAPLRGQLGRLGELRFGARTRVALDGAGAAADEAVPILAEDGGRLRVAITGDDVTLVAWIDRDDLAPVTLVEHRVASAAGATPPAELGVTVLPGHRTTGEVAGGWVRVVGHGGLAFDGWIPDDTGDTWEASPPPVAARTDVSLAAGTVLVDDAAGGGTPLARLTAPARARVIESVALGADRVEVVTADARAIGYATRPQLTRTPGSVGGTPFELPEHQLAGTRPRTPAVRACLHDGPGGPVVGVVQGSLISISPAKVPGWAVTPIRSPWGDVVLALPAPSWLARTDSRRAE